MRPRRMYSNKVEKRPEWYVIDLEIKTYKSLQIYSNNLLRVKYNKRTKSDSSYLFLTITLATEEVNFRYKHL